LNSQNPGFKGAVKPPLLTDDPQDRLYASPRPFGFETQLSGISPTPIDALNSRTTATTINKKIHGG
jgi:hypothetical protein